VELMAAELEQEIAIGAAVDAAVVRLKPVSATPRLDAEILLGEVGGLPRQRILAHPERAMTAVERRRFEAAIARRAAGEPLAYITGVREFWSLALAVSPRVLVPRPETELLVEVGLELLRNRNRARVVDLGTGSGAIALALLAARPDLGVTAVDSEPEALAVASANAAALGLDVGFVRSDWFSNLADERFDLAVCNPPYVRTGDPHFAGTLRFEPRRALDGGRDGLDAYRAVLGSAATHLRPGGRLVFEHGHDQREALTALAGRHGFRVVDARADLAGHPRVVVVAVAGGRPPVRRSATVHGTGATGVPR
jgi:release factor glutamine methyltransferase